MFKINFQYNQTHIEIQCNITDKIKEIIDRLIIKLQRNEIYIAYNGNRVDEELKLDEVISEQDKQNSNINMLIYDKEVQDNSLDKYVISDEIICPECKEKAFINVDYKIDILNCKNKHYVNSIKLEDFEETQKINISKIFCNNCIGKNRGGIYNYELYKCLTCKKNLCPVCKKKHDSSHAIINYDDKDFICEKHNNQFISYCLNCKENLCLDCKKGHKEQNHNLTEFEDILCSERDNGLEDNINNFEKDVCNIMSIFQEIINKLRIYQQLYDNFWNKTNKVKKRNYETLLNINEFNNFNQKLKTYINSIISESQVMNKIQKILDIEKNYILSKIEIKDDDVNQNIKIINSFEQWNRDKNSEIDKEKFKNYLNEDELKNNCEIIINDKKIPFSYFHKFNAPGEYNVKYIFKKRITRTVGMFSQCNNIKSLDFTNFDSRCITNTNGMFFENKSLAYLNIKGFNTNKVECMGAMFYNCNSLKSLDLSSFITEKVTDMKGLFCDCQNLESIKLPNFNTSKIKDFSMMFKNCLSLTGLDLSSFRGINATDLSEMFFGCKKLKELNLINFDIKEPIKHDKVFDSCDALKKENIRTNNPAILNWVYN